MRLIQNRFGQHLSKILIIALTFFIVGALNPLSTQAALLTTMSDSQSRLAATTLSDHTITFVTPTGITATSQSITINFNNYTTVTAITSTDVTIGVSASSACSGFSTRTDAASAGADTWGVSAATTILTLAGPTSGTIATSGIPAGRCVQIGVGTTGGGTIRVTNPSAGQATISVSVNGTSTDTGTIGIPIIANDQVALTATVNPTITFTLSQTSLGFGTLTTANGRWATNSGGATTATTGLVVTAATNGTSGYTIYVLGDTLKSGTNAITALASSTASSPNSSQFGMNAVVASTGSGVNTLQAPYSTASQYGWTATATAQTAVDSNNGPDSGSTFNVSYLANISAIVPAGSYSATHQWTIAGNF